MARSRGFRTPWRPSEVSRTLIEASRMPIEASRTPIEASKKAI